MIDCLDRLRLTKLNEEMRESEMSSNDDTYNEVFRDYTQLAHSHPERLVRARHNNNEGNSLGFRTRRDQTTLYDPPLIR